MPEAGLGERGGKEVGERAGAGRLAALVADLSVAAIAIAARLRFPVDPCDDAFIVLRAVRHALAGLGPHFEPAHGDAVLSTFLLPLLLGAARAGLPSLPLIPALDGLGLAAEVALALVVLRLATALSGSRVAGVAAAALLATHPVLLLPALGGMETALVLALVAGAALALERERFGGLALCCALLPWARVDATLAAVVLLGFGWFRASHFSGHLSGQLSEHVARRRASNRRWLVAGALGGAAAFVAHNLLYGIWLPASVTAKLAIGGGAGWEPWPVAREFLAATVGRSAYWLVEATPHAIAIPLAAWGAWRVVREAETRRRVAPLALWSFSYMGFFVLSGRSYATNFPWYFAPPLLPLMVLAAVGLAGIFRRGERVAGRAPHREGYEPLAHVPSSVPSGETSGQGGRVAGRWFATLAAPALAFGVWWAVSPSVGAGLGRVRSSFTAHRERNYAAVATWLGRHGAARSIAGNEIGTLGWFSPPGTEIVDLVGLSRRPDERGLDAIELVRRRRPDAVVARLDFPYRRALEAASPGSFLWVRAGSLDVGLTPAAAARLEPHRDELARIYAATDLEREPGRSARLLGRGGRRAGGPG